MLNASRRTGEDFIGAAQVQRDAEPRGEPHERSVLAVDEHVPGALHVRLFVANERIRRQDFGRPFSAQPTLQRVLAKWAVLARRFHVRQRFHERFPFDWFTRP